EARESQRGQPWWRKWPRLVHEGIRVLTHYPLLTVRLHTAEGRERVFKSRVITVSNNHYDEATPAEWPRRSRLDRQELGVYVLKYRSRLRLLLGFASLFSGRWRENPNIETIRTRE